MRQTIEILLLLFLTSFNCLSQKNVKEFFDADWNREDSAKAIYYRFISYKNGQPVGVVRDYHISGQLQFKGKMISVDPETMRGKCIWYYDNGQKQQIRYYKKNGTLKRKMKYYYENGNKLSVGKRLSNEQNLTIWKYYYDNGQIEHKVHYEKGNIIGIHKRWYPDGSLRYITYGSSFASIIYWTKQGEKKILIPSDDLSLFLNDSVDQESYPSKGIKIQNKTISIVDQYPPDFEYQIYTFKDYGLKEGKNKVLDSNRNLQYEFTLKNGLMDGIYIKYYENGNKECELSFRKNLKNGKSYWYREDGTIYSMEEYRRGKLHGISKKWRDTILVEERAFSNGKLHGWSKGVYFPFNPWEDDPKFYFIKYFKHDKQKKSKIFYLDTITLKPKAPMSNLVSHKKLNKRFSTKLIFYYENGQIHTEQNYKKGKTVGICTTYYSDGRKKAESESMQYNSSSYKLYSYWDSLGNQLVKDGNGKYVTNENGRKKEMTWQNECCIESVAYYANGKISSITKYNCSDLLTNTVIKKTWLDEEGRKSQERIVKDSTDTWTGWYSNGNKKLIHTYLTANENMKNGLWVDYYENGNKSQEGNYIKSKKEGVWKYYNKNNELIKEEFYMDNKLLKTINY